jgi:hypothetical protein
MQINHELEKQICHLRYAIKDAYECNFRGAAAPCHYFKALTGNQKAIGASCVKCRAERMTVFNDHNIEVDCYTLMILDFLKTLGMELDDES